MKGREEKTLLVSGERVVRNSREVKMVLVDFVLRLGGVKDVVLKL